MRRGRGWTFADYRARQAAAHAGGASTPTALRSHRGTRHLATLDGLTEILELRKHRLHDKPVLLLNAAGFYDGLVLQLRRMEEEGFPPRPPDEPVFITEQGAAAFAHLEESVAPGGKA